MTQSPDYRDAYEAAKKELSELLAQQESLTKRIMLVRETIQSLAALCESEGLAISPSQEASFLLVKVTLADEIRVILRAAYPEWLRPNQIKGHLARLGHDLSKYQNPQATIHMVLKRMVESEEVDEQVRPGDGKRIYRSRALPGSQGVSLKNAYERSVEQEKSTERIPSWKQRKK